MIDYDREIETMEGLPARCLCRDRACTDGRRFVVLMKYGENELTTCLTADGKQYSSDHSPSIRNKPREIVVWLNVYDGPSGSVWSKRDSANRNAGPGRLACVRVAVKEGTFDD